MHMSGWFLNLKIRYKLLFGYSTIFFLSLMLGNAILYSFVRRTIEFNIESELQNTTTTILNMVETAINVSIKNHLRAVAEKNREIARYFYRLYLDGKIDEKEAIERAAKVLLSQKIGKTGYIYCLNSHGIIVNHPEKALLGVDLSDNAFIRDQKKRKNGYLEYDWKNPTDRKPRPKALYMTYFKPWDWIISVSSYRSEFRQLVNVDDFRESILSLKFGKTGYPYVINDKGFLVIHPKLESANIINEKDAEGNLFIKDLIKQKNGKIIYSWRNPDEEHYRKKLVIFNHIPEFGWIVAASSYLDEFYSPLETVKRIFLFTFFILLILVIPLSLWISSTITNPLRELMDRFSTGAAGDISVRMKRSSKDEIGILAKYFNSFMQTLEDYSKNLKEEITDRKKAEENIRRSEAKYRELVQNANSIIMRVDTRGRITFFNEFAQSFFGFSEDEVIGKKGLETIVPLKDSTGRSMSDLMEKIARFPEKHKYYETENVRKDGERVWVAWTNKAVRDSKGRIVEFLCVGNDITEARAAEKEMVRMRHYLQNIVDSMPSILIGIDLNGCITQWNHEAFKLTRVEQRRVMGKNVVSVFPKFEEHMELIENAIQNKSIIKKEKVRHPAKEGTHYADIMIYPIIVKRVEGVVLRIDDVTHRVRMQDMMVQTEKMMSVGGLAAGMAHEINNPLGGMLQSAQNVIRRLSPELPANHQAAEACGTRLEVILDYMNKRKITHFIEGIRASGEKAHQIVANMLNFSRKSDSWKEPVLLDELLNNTISLAAHDYDLKKKYDFRHITIVKEFEPGMKPVSCVATEIEQVILNLLRNAAQAMASHTRSSGKTSKIILRLFTRNDFAVISVEDNGPGMAPNTLKRVFEPFYTTKEIGTGTGLGLSVSYFIVSSNHNGSIEVESEHGKGTTFTICLPLEPLAR